MQKIQRVGFIMLPSTFIIVGLVCLIAGIIAKERTLKIMGAIWLPMGILALILILHMLKKENNS